MKVIIKQDLAGVNWQEMKDILVADNFDNGRSPKQLQLSFENSFVTSIAYLDGRIIGTARALSDQVCNAYVVDVWTMSKYRHKGIARQMMQALMTRLHGQHIYLFTDDAVGFYQKLGFEEQGIGMSIVIGQWLKNESAVFDPA